MAKQAILFSDFNNVRHIFLKLRQEINSILKPRPRVLKSAATGTEKLARSEPTTLKCMSFIYSQSFIHHFTGFFRNQHNDQLSVGLLA